MSQVIVTRLMLDAANDVVCAVELFKTLTRKAETDGIVLDLDAMCANLGNVPKSLNTPKPSIEPLAQVPSPIGENLFPSSQFSPTSLPVGVQQREWRTLMFFREGSSIAEIAQSSGIKDTTVQSVSL